MSTDTIFTTVIHWLYVVADSLPIVTLVAAVLFVCFIVVRCVLALFDMRHLLQQKSVLLELTPPAATDRVLAATQQLFAVLHGLEESRGFLVKLARRRVAFSLEVIATREQGIRYLIRAGEHETSIIEQAILSYLPDVKTKIVYDYITDHSASDIQVLDIKQTGHFAYPLSSQGDLEKHDPMAYLTGAMTHLASGELMAVQLVTVPVRVNEAHTLARRLLHNQELVSKLGRRKLPVLDIVFGVINSVLFAILDAIGDMVSGPTIHQYGSSYSQHQQQVAMNIKPARVLSPIEQKLAESVNAKLNQPLFTVNIRALVVVNNQRDSKDRARAIRDWLALFKNAKYQTLRPRFTFIPKLQQRYRQWTFWNRLPSAFRGNASIFSSSEIADLYHFPHTTMTKTENVVKSLSKTLPAPLSLKNKPELDVVIGMNNHHGVKTPIGLTAKEREQHMYIVGGTGNGKTTMLEYGIVQDIQNGKGVGVIDPHGDLAKELLEYIPKERIEDVIYLRPSDVDYPIGLNLLELPEGLTDTELLVAKDFIAEAVISVMRKIFSDDDTGGHRIEYILRNAVHTAFTVEGATIFTVYDLLTDDAYRKEVVRGLKNKQLKNFWNNEFAKAGGMQRVKMGYGVTSKVGRFEFSVFTKRMMSQAKSTIDFDEILDGKILICDLAKGEIAEDTSELFGVSILAKLQLAAYRRVRQRQKDRKPFYLYVDEFQNFATPSFVQMLSEARKYKLFLIMAEQSTSQQDHEMVENILSNVGTVISFKTGNPVDEKYLLPFFEPYIEQNEIKNLPSYHFYARLSAVHSQEPLSGETIVPQDEQEGNATMPARVEAASRKNYATEYIDADQKLESEPTAPKKPKKSKKKPSKEKPKQSPNDKGKWPTKE